MFFFIHQRPPLRRVQLTTKLDLLTWARLSFKNSNIKSGYLISHLIEYFQNTHDINSFKNIFNEESYPLDLIITAAIEECDCKGSLRISLIHNWKSRGKWNYGNRSNLNASSVFHGVPEVLLVWIDNHSSPTQYICLDRP